MSGSSVDTNVVLYLAGNEAGKAETVRELLAPATPISVQVLNETASVLIRKWHWPWSETIDFLDLVRSFTTVRPLTEQTHDLGLAIARRHLLNIYDALIVAAALEADCDTLYSEDMHAGLVVDGRLRIVNPFA